MGLALREFPGLDGRELVALPLPPRRILRGLMGRGRVEASVSVGRGVDVELIGEWGREIEAPAEEASKAVEEDEEERCFFFCFLREDSLPLASERLGEPERLRMPFVVVEEEEVEDFLLSEREGVLVPFVEGMAEGGFVAAVGTSAVVVVVEEAFAFSFSFSFSCAAVSSAFLRSSSLWRSVSLSEVVLCNKLLAQRLLVELPCWKNVHLMNKDFHHCHPRRQNSSPASSMPFESSWRASFGLELWSSRLPLPCRNPFPPLIQKCWPPFAHA